MINAQDVSLVEIRCPHCQRLIFKSAECGARIEAKCPSCNNILYFAGVAFGKPIFLEIEGKPPATAL